MEHKIKEKIADIFKEMADNLENKDIAKKIKIGITTLGSEHGVDNIIKGAELASKRYPFIEVVLIGQSNNSYLKSVETSCEKEQHEIMERMLENNEIQGCVTLHYNFPVGVSTVGRVITPSKGKELFIATTTGTSSVNRVESMVRNAIHGIVAAKATGIKEPTVGILNVEGARQVERVLKALREQGYDMKFATSLRADGGCVMRGNDLLTASTDVMVTDSLTGNLLIKIFSAYNTGGSYEAIGYGYGPGVGEGYDKNILIISRASGSPLIAQAIKYAAEVAMGNIIEVAKDEFTKANKANLKSLFEELNKDKKTGYEELEEEIVPPEKEIVTESIAGVDIMDLEDAVAEIWKNKIYAESGMGCTGPIVMVNERNIDIAKKMLIDAGFLAKD